MPRILFPAAFAFLAPLLPAAAQAQRQDQQAWLQVNTNVPLASDVRLTLEQIGRVGERAGGLFQTEFGGILGYRAWPGVEIGIGYRKVGMHNSAARAEDRVRQHVIATFGPVVTRFRLDERFHPDGDEIGFRVRPLVRYNHAIGKGVFLFASHESFYLPNATRWGQRQGYERMRNIVGVTLPMGKGASADVGYLNQFRPARTGAQAQMDHAISVQVTLNPALAPILTD